MPPRLHLIAIRSSDFEKAVRIYEAIGLKFERHSHGNGPEHYASEHDGFVFEIYPLSPDHQATVSTRIGFEVESVDETVNGALSAGAKLIVPAKHGPWGYRAVIADLDGHRVELTERPRE